MSMYDITSLSSRLGVDTDKLSPKKILGYNRWPGPHNYVTDIQVLVCNQDTFIFQMKLAFALGAHFFWTNLFPSPREVERKFFTGGYRCGFLLNVKVKSPIEILFGRGTNTIIGEIVQPFARGAFYLWVEQVAFSALSTFTTLIYPFLFCQDNIGAGLRRLDVGTFGQGHNQGVPGLGVYSFDRLGFMSLTNATVFFPAGYWKVFCTWFVMPTAWPIQNLKLGIGTAGHAWRVADMEDGEPGLPSTHITQESGWSGDPITIHAWCEGDLPVGALISSVECVMFTYDWSPTPFDPDPGYLQQPSDRPYGRPGGDGSHAGPRVPPLCGWMD